jgi:diadenosine tetraphosphate (Ap4A) HIT family hydrolase
VTGFTLDPRLQGDTLAVAERPACRLLVMNDARWPWAILAPRVPGASELFALPADMRRSVEDEVAAVAARMADWPGVEKVNVGALGNIVRQLHVHVIGRRTGDPNWPGPVWGFGARIPYGPGEADALIGWLRSA